jgi:hypothetical protein
MTMAERESTFRGFWSIAEVRERTVRFADWLQKFKLDCHEITLARKDFDLIRRWPKAAQLNEFTITDESVTFKGFKLKPAKGEGRYEHADQDGNR